MSNFAFLAAEFPAVHEAAMEAERQAGVSPTAAAFFAGKTVEIAVKWAFKSDPNLKLPYQDNISALLHEPSFRRAAGEAVFAKARYINTLRNRAVHEEKTISAGDAAGAVKELFHVCFWLARTYARKAKPADTRYPPRQIGGFYKRDELELVIQRRTSRKKLGSEAISRKIVERPYQHRAIRNVARSFEQDGERKALLVMATGSGKTRTVIALVDLLMRAGWVKRVLFLADRVALVNQAAGAFKAHLPDAAPVNLVTERTSEGRVFLSTYPTMMNPIDGKQEGKAKFGPGHFDLIVIDEAHRSVYQRFRAIFEYFDSFLIGLTATPKDEIDKNTYSLFDLEDGVPTDAYSLDEAVADGWLVPPMAISVPLKIVRSGLRYDELSEEETRS